MKPKKITYILANFGGPRDLAEVAPFIKELLLDPEVIRPKLPLFLHKMLFSWIAYRRSKKTVKDYEKIGGKSPIFEDTERVAKEIEKRTETTVIPFHRYLPKTHKDFFQNVIADTADEIRIFPLFPQFTYATTGSIARFFSERLPKKILNKLRWVKSYPAHPGFIKAYKSVILDFLESKGIKEEEAFLLFSSHGVPKSFIEEGDLYQMECQMSFEKLINQLPKSEGLLCYQSQFGPEEWIKPYTDEVCTHIENYCPPNKKIVIVPLSFTSDHIETLFEIEELYIEKLHKKGYNAYRCPALNFHPDWMDAILEILKEGNWTNNQMLVR
jgi:protoporphyrin/coproporphyrin ferrochelatase